MKSDAHGAEHPEGLVHGSAEHLVKMANDIGNFFRAEPEREDAVAGIANHIAKFWTKRMREKLAAHLKREGDAGLDELPREALLRLIAQQAAAPQTASQAAPPQPAAR
jgi:formate dehydrogenase subunit delta